MQLSVFGLGHAGAVATGCLVSQGHEVVACDPDPSKMDLIRRGIGPVKEPGLDELIKEAVDSGRLTATTNVAEAVANSALSNIFASTPHAWRDERDFGNIVATCKQIGIALGAKSKFHSIVLRTALPPDATRGVLIPAMERASGKRAGIDFGVAVYPTFLRRGTAIQDCVNPPAMLLGVTDDETLARLREMEIALPAPELVVDLAEAEAMTRGGVWLASETPVEKKPTIFPGFPSSQAI
jgi:GDP-mannose 6-dehydrogenase